ncbi:MAG: sigma-70 family RNA polymerase sigma factor [Labilithrix sp.]|nr:sigma-70 family RNA polymerase sigma factor [Labilithrix sp.]
MPGARAACDSLTDGALAREIASASRSRAIDAERELCRRFARPIRLYGYRHLGAEAAAADLVQEVLLAVLTALREGRVSEPDRLAAFVVGTCRFIARRWSQRDRRRDAMTEELAAQLLSDVAPEPRPLDHARLEVCIDELGARERKVVYMAFHEDRSAQEIADALRLTAVNVRVIRHRALGRLRACIERCDGAGEGAA